MSMMREVVYNVAAEATVLSCTIARVYSKHVSQNNGTHTHTVLHSGVGQ